MYAYYCLTSVETVFLMFPSLMYPFHSSNPKKCKFVAVVVFAVLLNHVHNLNYSIKINTSSEASTLWLVMWRRRINHQLRISLVNSHDAHNSRALIQYPTHNPSTTDSGATDGYRPGPCCCCHKSSSIWYVAVAAKPNIHIHVPRWVRVRIIGAYGVYVVSFAHSRLKFLVVIFLSRHSNTDHKMVCILLVFRNVR